MTKYCTNSEYGTVDNITTLETVDDAASQIMGSDWRMPTKADFQELLNGTTNEWITNFNNTGVNGRKFTSKTDTSKYIFIPAAGCCDYGSVYYVGNYGYVLSSSLRNPNPRNAEVLDLYSRNCYINDNARYIGRPVRGVRK